MITLLVLVPILFVFLVLHLVFRALTLPFRLGRRRQGYGLGHRHRHGFGGSLLSIAALFALDRLFNNRRF